MAYSTNPFSVATFGESYEQADASFTLTGVAGTGAIDTGILTLAHVPMLILQGYKLMVQQVVQQQQQQQ
jgi:hypothetical protein